MKKITIFIYLLLIVISLTGCQTNVSLCEPGSIIFRDRFEKFSTDLDAHPTSQTIKIKKKMVRFDQVISGQLCNNSLKGTVYIGCDIEIYNWSETPNFLEDCNFKVEPGTVIYVASHNNSAFYRGCNSCHAKNDYKD